VTTVVGSDALPAVGVLDEPEAVESVDAVGLVLDPAETVAVAAPAFLVAGSLAGRAGVTRRPAPFAALAAAGVALVLFGSLLLPWLGARWADQALQALTYDHPARAVRLAERSRSVDPVALDPLLYQALAEQSRGRLARTDRLYLRATEVQPEAARAWRALGEFELTVLGCPRASLPHLERYTALDPQARPELGAVDKDRALALVNSGTPTC